MRSFYHYDLDYQLVAEHLDEILGREATPEEIEEFLQEQAEIAAEALEYIGDE